MNYKLKTLNYESTPKSVFRHCDPPAGGEVIPTC